MTLRRGVIMSSTRKLKASSRAGLAKPAANSAKPSALAAPFGSGNAFRNGRSAKGAAALVCADGTSLMTNAGWRRRCPS